MALVFSGIVPHPPILLPSLGKDNLPKVKSTTDALSEMEGDLYVAQPDVIFIITPHAPINPDAFSLNLASEFITNYKDLEAEEAELKFQCDIELVNEIREPANSSNLPTGLISEAKLDHSASVPLYFLTQHLPSIKIVPISYSELSLKLHFEFGSLLRKVASDSNKRVAIIASGDLSHCLTPDAPAGYNAEGKTFDNLLLDLLDQRKVNDIINIKPDLIKSAAECGLRSVVMLLGALEGLDYKFNKLSYEAPFGVGYLVAELPFN